MTRQRPPLYLFLLSLERYQVPNYSTFSLSHNGNLLVSNRQIHLPRLIKIYRIIFILEHGLDAKDIKVFFIREKLCFAKLWDGWKHSSEEADREIAIYDALHQLWGIIIPKLITHGGWGFSHIIVIEFIKIYILVMPPGD